MLKYSDRIRMFGARPEKISGTASMSGERTLATARTEDAAMKTVERTIPAL